MYRRTPQQSGYTLIELLLYVVIVSGLLLSITYFFSTLVSARVKNQTVTEVDEQGAAAMDYITRTIRNASSITTPATGGSGGALALTVPTAGLSPTIFDLSNASTLGYSSDGGSTDTGDSDSMNATKFVASTSGTITTLYAMIGATVGASPSNKGQMAIYSGASSPSTLLASSASVDLTASSWNAFPISSVSVTSGQTYWLAYNTNGTTSAQNNLRYHAGTSGQSMFTTQSFGIWQPSWSGTNQAFEFSMYAPISVGGSAGLHVKEGAGSAVPLTNDNVQVSGLSFKNLTRPGTPGIIQVTFTVSRINSSGRNEYDYQKTFTGSAEVSW